MTQRDPLCVGLDVGGTKLSGAVVASDGSLVAEARHPTPDEWPDLAGTALGLVHELREREPGVAAIGVGAAGLVDLDGVILYAPNIAGFRHARVQAVMTDATGLPVVVDNDANAAAFGEVSHGAARGLSHALVMTLGTGIGGGIVADGKVYRGARGFAAEIGHFTIDPSGPMCACGVRGHWEAFASGSALGRMGREAAGRGEAPSVLDRAGGDPGRIDGHDVSDAAIIGAPDALAILERYAGYVAVGLAALANILDPARIVISGGLVAIGDPLFEPLRRAFHDEVEGSSFRGVPDIVPAELGERAGMIGAAAMARALV